MWSAPRPVRLHLLGALTIQVAVGITTARVSQIVNLNRLAPDIQQAILELESTTERTDPFLERQVREVATHINWVRQRKEFKKLSSKLPQS